MKFKKILPLIGIISTGFVLSTSSVSAAPIFDNGFGNIGYGNLSDSDGTSIRADDFSLTASGTTIRSIHWRGRYYGAETPLLTDDFTLKIYSDSSGPTGSPLHEFFVGDMVNRTESVMSTAFGDQLFDYSADITATLTAGTTYWLSIFNDTTADSDDNWSWISSDSGTFGSGAFASYNNGTSWSGPAPNESSFRLDNAAVPAAVWLMGSALVGLFGFSRQKSTTA